MRHGSSNGGGLRKQNRQLRKVQQELFLSELTLRRRISQHALLTEVATVLLGTESLGDKLERCARQIVDQLRIDCVLIWSADAAGAMALAASAGLCDGLPPPEPPGESLVGAVVEQRKRVVRQSVPDEPPSANQKWAKRQQMRAFAGYPLLCEDTLLGVLAVYAREELAQDALDTLALVAGQIAMGIERLRRLEEREHLLSSEHQARLNAERATRIRDHLLAIVAHDLRSPLSAIVTSTALLKRVRVLGEKRWLRHLQTITNSVERMNRLIHDLLDVASVEAGRLRFALSRHTVSSLMRELVEQYLPLAESRGLRLEVEDQSRSEIAGDRGRLLQAMFNLLDNAFKFSPPGGTVWVRARRRGSEVVISVTDTGPGITETDRAHVFEPYWQADPRSRSGLGLGLSIAKGVVEAHRGRVWFESPEGGGTTFFVGLPVLADSAADEARPPL